MGIRQFVRTRSLQTRLLLSFATLFAVVLGGGLLTWYSSATIRSQQDATLSAARRLQLCEEIAGYNVEMFAAEKNMILGGVTHNAALVDRATTQLQAPKFASCHRFPASRLLALRSPTPIVSW